MSIISSKAEHVYKSNTLMQEVYIAEPHASTRTWRSNDGAAWSQVPPAGM